MIEGRGLPEPVSIMDYSRKEVEDAITHLYKLSKCMRKRRFDGGALSINSVRLSIKLDAQGEPESVSIYELKDANRLIEEFMLCANMSVAEKICTHYPEDAMLRRHSPPIERRLVNQDTCVMKWASALTFFFFPFFPFRSCRMSF